MHYGLIRGADGELSKGEHFAQRFFDPDVYDRPVKEKASRKKLPTVMAACRLSKYKGFPCEVRRINAEALERSFLRILERLSWDGDLMAKAAAEQIAISPDDTELKEKEAALNDQLREIGRKISNVLAAVEDGLAGSSVQGRLQELERQRAILQSEIAQLRLAREQHRTEPVDTEEAMSLFCNCSELFQVMTLDQKERLVDAILKSATVDKDKVAEFELYVGEDTINVVQNVKVGSPILTIAQHRSRITIRIRGAHQDKGCR